MLSLSMARALVGLILCPNHQFMIVCVCVCVCACVCFLNSNGARNGGGAASYAGWYLGSEVNR